MAKLALAVVGASNLVVAFAAGAYMFAENDITLIPTLALVASLGAAFLAACAIETFDDRPEDTGSRDARTDALLEKAAVGRGVNRPPKQRHIAHDGGAPTP